MVSLSFALPDVCLTQFYGSRPYSSRERELNETLYTKLKNRLTVKSINVGFDLCSSPNIFYETKQNLMQTGERYKIGLGSILMVCVFAFSFQMYE